ncbi:hypothetical protein MB02_09095 [Croceicoccus estronivorus]|uniref:hypothetical protein n=1 Tax=Croceicoccus estronivorus TaxID=1172626 RepID=UPI0008372FE5|nr:hypothetical protein [Croceicoccus estronivorus]OCC23959.1 hypothetical protein MB02_09095 [Croceicoccus estronivorus]
MSPKLILPLALLPLVAACVSPSQPGGPKSPGSVRVPPTAPQRPVTRWRPARPMNLPGLEGVIGADANTLIRQFGQPRLNVTEGDAHKLQFSGTPCVLDVYLYPPSQGASPRATYVDARRASDGQDVDRAACVAALRR